MVNIPQSPADIFIGQTYSSAVIYGAFGIKNMWALYPATPWAFLIGALVGVGCAVGQIYGRKLVELWRRTWSDERFEWWQTKVFRWFSWMEHFNPSVFVSGMAGEFLSRQPFSASYDTPTSIFPPHPCHFAP